MKLGLFALAGWVASGGWAGAADSPEVHPDRTVTFHIAAPKASEVTFTGDWISAAQKMTKSDNGTWSITLGPLPPSTYIYSYTVDGIVMNDPVNPRVKQRGRTSASLVEVPAEKPGVQEAQDVPHGAVEMNWMKSRNLGGETRRVLVYTPPGYAADRTHRYPMLLLLHGSNDTPESWNAVGNLNFLADNLIAEKKMTPMVMIMTSFYSSSSPPFTPTVGVEAVAAPGAAPAGQRGGGRGGNNGNKVFYSYLLEEVMPMVEAKYRIAEGRDNHAVAGMSMGANQSLDLFLSHFDKFSSVGVLCASRYDAIESSYDALLKDSKSMNAKAKVIWIGCGRQDTGHFSGSQRVADVLTAHQINHIWHPTEGVHNYAIWRDYMEEFLPLLFQRQTAPAPAFVMHGRN